MKITFTYYTVTPKSAENGEFEDHGFYDVNGGWKYSWNDEKIKQDILDNPKDYDYDGGLQQALIEAQRLGCCESSQSPVSSNNTRISFSSVDSDTNYATMEQTYYTVHFSDIGQRTLNRICKEMGVKVV